jgi:opacity protein-like surface antigen
MKKLLAVALVACVAGSIAVAPAAQAKKKKPKKPAACAAYTPGELGADKPIVKLTDANTEAAPLEQKVSLDQSAADVDILGAGAPESSADAFNIQVDSTAKDVGLYLTLQFDQRRDYDLWLRYADGSEAAGSHGWNTIVEDPADNADFSMSDEGYASDSTDSSENIIGVHVTDCSGWTVEVDNYLGEGGEMTVKAWLGDIKNEPLAPGQEEPA